MRNSRTLNGFTSVKHKEMYYNKFLALLIRNKNNNNNNPTCSFDILAAYP